MRAVRKGALGVKFDLYVYETDLNGVRTTVNLAAVTTKDFIFSKPDTTTVTKAASFKTDGTDGWLRYVNSAGNVDLDQAGTWTLEASLVFPAGYSGKTFIEQFYVRE